MVITMGEGGYAVAAISGAREFAPCLEVEVRQIMDLPSGIIATENHLL